MTNKSLPSVPSPLPVISIPAIQLNKSVDLATIKEKIIPVTSATPLSFEDLNQGNGYVLYSKKFVQPISGTLTIKGLRDFATVYVNGERVGVLNRNTKTYSMPIDIPFNAVLEILVENMGRINYGSEIINNLKGIISPVLIDSTEITGGWNMYRLPFNEKPSLVNISSKNTKGRPTLFQGIFQLQKTGDTFLDMSAWGKGIVFVNGHNLGRYWSVGPQQTLYLPGVWLKKGLNEIIVFEQLNDQATHTIEGLVKPILEKLNIKK
jgi:beta-galactosidase